MKVTSAPRPAPWQPATVVSIREETPRVKTIRFAVGNWPGHLPGHPASHGCIRLPSAFAKKLYSVTNLGTPVLIGA